MKYELRGMGLEDKRSRQQKTRTYEAEINTIKRTIQKAKTKAEKGELISGKAGVFFIFNLG